MISCVTELFAEAPEGQLCRSVDGKELPTLEFQEVAEAFPHQDNAWIYRHRFYFRRDGSLLPVYQ